MEKVEPLNERQYGTVREGYSEKGNAWMYLIHDQAHFRTYRWGEDSLVGISDGVERLCSSLTLRKGKDLIPKERLFCLMANEGNQGEDVKEDYYYIDDTPTHFWMRYLYEYPQQIYTVQEAALTASG